MSEQSEPKPSDPVVKEISGRIGRYEVVKPRGKGAMGMVYEAYDTVLERNVALKVMVAGIADDPELKARFEREARAVAKMTHPNVVMVFDLGYHTDGSPFIAMELLEGMDLQKAMRRQQMSLDRKVAVMIHVLTGLAHAHDKGIIHRDIKPANIWINDDGSVKIMDFGVARLTTASMTGTGSIVGTADYMSPEQVKGAKVDGRSDVFSVGCMLYELLTGKRPFRAENLMAIFYRITHEEPDWEAIPHTPQTEALLPILRKALSKELNGRYGSAYEFAVDLREYLKRHATSASGEHALDDLAELVPPPEGGPPPPITGDYSGATVVEGTVDMGTAPGGRTAPGTQAPTVVTGGATTVAGTRPGTAATVVSRPGVRRRVARPAMTPQPVPAQSGSPVLYSLVGGLVVVAAVLGGYIWYSQQQPPPVTTPSTTMAAATPAPTPPPTTQPAATPEPTPTVAPPPPTLSPSGKAARNLQAAQAAFDRGDYDTAAEQAQAAMRIDAGNAGAKDFLARAMKGQEAEGHFRQARSALDAKDFAGARRAAQAGSAAAPWDRRGPQLIGDIQAAEAAVQRAQRTAQIQGLLSQAQDKLAAKDYVAAIALSNQVLAIDAGNATANQLKTAAVSAQAIADASASAGSGRPAGGGKSFVTGKTETQTKQASDVPPGFNPDSGIQATSATSAVATPGRLDIEVSPKQVKPGDEFSIRVRMHNEGTAPIQIRNIMVTVIRNSGRTGGAAPSLVSEVAPRQDAVILEAPGGIWREDTTEFRFEVRVSTADGAVYKNAVEWK